MKEEINCIRVVDTDLRIALRSNWSYRSQRVRSGFGEGEVAYGGVIIIGGHDFDPLIKLSKSYPNRRDVISCHTE